MRIIGPEIAARLDWHGALATLEAGHRAPRAELGDLFLGPPDDTLMARAARIDGLGAGVKTFSVRPGNAAMGLPSVQGAMLLFDGDGAVEAAVDFATLTRWKTVADSLLGARLLARPDARHLLICGAGEVAEGLAQGYAAIFPALEQITVWNRTEDRATALTTRLAAHGMNVKVTTDLAAAAQDADIIACATMARTPFLRGNWLKKGAHLDLVGSFKADMREADDLALKRALLFVDCRDTAAHVGEIALPLAEGTIEQADILGDHYDLMAGVMGRRSNDDITICKNAGGAHLDLMIARWMVAKAG